MFIYRLTANSVGTSWLRVSIYQSNRSPTKCGRAGCTLREIMFWTGRAHPRLLLLVFAFLLIAACSKPRNQELLDQHRNLGKAYYENPATGQQSVQEFKQALQIAPDSARDKLNYALALLKVPGREQEAVELLRQVQRQDPTLPHTWFNLGIYYKHQGDAKQAIAHFEG